MKIEDKIFKFQQSIEKSKYPVMFFDRDSDGLLSYLILKRKYKKIKGFPFEKELDKQKDIAIEHATNCDLIIIFDIPVISNEFFDILNDVPILWMDHHKSNAKKQIDLINKNIDNNNQNSSNKYITYLNPLDFNSNDNRPACYFSYLVCNDKNNLDLVVLGSICDFFLLDVIEKLYYYDKKKFKQIISLKNDEIKTLLCFLEKNMNHENKQVESSDQRDEWIRYLLYNTNIRKLNNFFNFLFKLRTKDEILKGINMIESCSIYELNEKIEFQKSELFDKYNNMELKYKDIFSKATKKKQNEIIFFYDYIGEIGFSKTLSEELNYLFKDILVVCVCFKHVNKKNYNCSIRGRNFNVRLLLEDVINGLKAQGGGHQFAVGASIDQDDFPIFKKRIFEFAKNKKYMI
ncbi:MAG: DHH family phosphoesterase [Nanoarchaeota archaeon]